jgi:hypothetical protein
MSIGSYARPQDTPPHQTEGAAGQLLRGGK